ncbi:omega-amidase, chloroplastic [Artemisia annua]|uniref:Omega-amidase, chloroplastic n=1 Tax=Artemisia annua TaxID=35608 RepID=A0A2U1N0M5_ARTAN|nr:omega-amidase, chloroplastic [Artemisia annua]
MTKPNLPLKLVYETWFSGETAATSPETASLTSKIINNKDLSLCIGCSFIAERSISAIVGGSVPELAYIHSITIVGGSVPELDALCIGCSFIAKRSISAIVGGSVPELAYIHSITIVGGSVPELDGNRLYNTCCVFGPNGKLLGKHRKLHLFDIVNTARGELCFNESDSFAAGNQPTVVDTDVCRIGIGICHDIRFPELAMLYQARGVELICYPSAFNITTGSMLWELEQQARQIYIATCSPSRNSSGSYEIWGHSTLVAPDGEFVGKLEHEEGVLIAEIDLSAINHQRWIYLDPKARNDTEYKLETFSGVYRKLSGKDVVFEYPMTEA